MWTHNRTSYILKNESKELDFLQIFSFHNSTDSAEKWIEQNAVFYVFQATPMWWMWKGQMYAEIRGLHCQTSWSVHNWPANGWCYLWFLWSLDLPWQEMFDNPCLCMCPSRCKMYRVWKRSLGPWRQDIFLLILWQLFVRRWSIWTSGT